jgi:hypothetical protein
MPFWIAGPPNPARSRYLVPVVLALNGNRCPAEIATVPNARTITPANGSIARPIKQKNLAKVFRARFLEQLNKCGFSVPTAPCEWIVDCRQVGKGIAAIKYLSKYLYKGVIGEKNIVADKNGKVTFRYVDSETKSLKYRTLPGEDFICLLLQHVLPKGFRRARDYGFLHANAKKLLSLVQLVLHVVILEVPLRPRPAFICPRCKSPMVAIGFRLKPG